MSRNERNAAWMQKCTFVLVTLWARGKYVFVLFEPKGTKIPSLPLTSYILTFNQICCNFSWLNWKFLLEFQSRLVPIPRCFPFLCLQGSHQLGIHFRIWGWFPRLMVVFLRSTMWWSLENEKNWFIFFSLTQTAILVLSDNEDGM